MKILVTQPIPQAAQARLREAGCALQIREEDGPPGAGSLREQLVGVEGLLSQSTDPLDASVLEGADRLRVICQMGVGVNNIDLAAATRKKIAVCHTPGVPTEAAADFTLALMLGVARRLTEGDRWIRGELSREGQQDSLLGSPVYGKSLGIIGMGKVGAAVARRARGFDMPVLYTSRTRQGWLESHLGVQWQPLQTILREVDFLSLHVPASPDTRHLIGEAELGLMKPTAILINTSWSEAVEEKALMSSLKESRLGGAGLDIFAGREQVSAAWKAMPRVVLASQASSATRETRERMAAMAATQILAVLQGQSPTHCLNQEVL